MAVLFVAVAFLDVRHAQTSSHEANRILAVPVSVFLSVLVVSTSMHEEKMILTFVHDSSYQVIWNDVMAMSAIVVSAGIHLAVPESSY